MKKIKGLDTLRAFAVFFVIIAHFGVWFDNTSPSGIFIANVLIPDGVFGVDLFFVLSGFLITSILLNAKKNIADTGRSFIIKNFFARRALRIFPIYYLLLFGLYLINYPDVRQYFWYFATYTANLLPYRTNSWNRLCHTWTLSVEEQFYFIWPWVITFIKEKYLKYVLVGAVLTGVITTYITMQLQGHMGPFLVFNFFDSFGIGGLYAWSRLDLQRCKKFETVIKLSAIAALAAYFFWNIAIAYHKATPGLFMRKTVNSIIALWLIILVVNNRSQLTRKYFLGNRVLNYIGKISYGIYLYHFPYIGFFFAIVNKFFYNITLPYPSINKVVHDHHFDYWLEILIIVLIAGLSYKFIEKPILRLKKYFNYNAEVATNIAKSG